MNANFLDRSLSEILKVSPFLLCVLSVFLDSVPFYLLDYSSFNTQFGLIIIYCWVVIADQRLRPIILFLFGVFIDLFNNSVFGFSSLFFLLILLIQRKSVENLLARDFSITWLKFCIFLLVYHILNFVILNLFFEKVDFYYIELLFSIIISIILFPMLFFSVNFVDEKIKYIDE